jgi:hypothetical protein
LVIFKIKKALRHFEIILTEYNFGGLAMVDTTRIQSGFDAKLQLGSFWFLSAIQTLIDNGVVDLPDGIDVTDIQIFDDPTGISSSQQTTLSL